MKQQAIFRRFADFVVSPALYCCLFAVVLLQTANVAAQSYQDGPFRYQAESDRVRSFEADLDLADAGAVETHTHNGHINVTSWDEPRVRIDGRILVHDRGAYILEEVFKEIRIQADLSGDRLKIYVIHPWKNTGNTINFLFWNIGGEAPEFTVDFDVKIPKASGCTARTHNGPISVQALEGNAAVSSHNGSVQISDIRGSVTANTHNGDIEIRRVGAVTVRSHNGDIALEQASGTVQVNSHNGRLSLAELSGSLDVRTHGGNITIDQLLGNFKGNSHSGRLIMRHHQGPVQWKTHNGHIDIEQNDFTANDRIQLKSHSGRMTLRIPPNLEADFYGNAPHGSINLDIPLTIRGEQKKNTLRGQFGNGGGDITVETHNGAIQVLALNQPG